MMSVTTNDLIQQKQKKKERKSKIIYDGQIRILGYLVWKICRNYKQINRIYKLEKEEKQNVDREEKQNIDKEKK